MTLSGSRVAAREDFDLFAFDPYSKILKTAGGVPRFFAAPCKEALVVLLPNCGAMLCGRAFYHRSSLRTMEAPCAALAMAAMPFLAASLPV